MPDAKLGELDAHGWPSGNEVLTPADDRIHEGSDDPMWNESAWFGFMIPEFNLMGGVHFHHRPNMNLLSQKVLLCGARRFFSGVATTVAESRSTTAPTSTRSSCSHARWQT